MSARNILQLGVRAGGTLAAALTLAGCVSVAPGSDNPQPPVAGYPPALPGYRPQLSSAVMPRVTYPPQAAPAPSRPQPAAVVPSAPADPPAELEPAPLIPVEPVARHRVDPSCTDYWDWCHFF